MKNNNSNNDDDSNGGIRNSAVGLGAGGGSPLLGRAIPLHVRLYYMSRTDSSGKNGGTPKMVESKVAVGGVLKGQPLFEMEDELGRVGSLLVL